MRLPKLGVVLVAYNSADVILNCLESLTAATGVQLHVVVVDNASTDSTPDVVSAWANGSRLWVSPAELPFALKASDKPIEIVSPDDLTPVLNGHQERAFSLIRASVNGGFAAGVNIGLAQLARDPDIQRFWILNPDSLVPDGTARAFASFDAGQFSLMGGRVLYGDEPDRIQTDGGTVNHLTGITSNINWSLDPKKSAAPLPSDLDFIMGANMVASRQHYETAGPMEEGYFLYYEEVDWAFRRNTLPLVYCPEGVIYHYAGSSIGSGNLSRTASPFSIYFLNRSRMLFVRCFFPSSIVVALLYSFGKVFQLLLRGNRTGAQALCHATLGMPPPKAIRSILSDDAAYLAFAAPKIKPFPRE